MFLGAMKMFRMHCRNQTVDAIEYSQSQQHFVWRQPLIDPPLALPLAIRLYMVIRQADDAVCIGFRNCEALETTDMT
jgi:hypothetical protein